MNARLKNILRRWALLLFPLLLIVPNIALAFTESDPWLYKVANIALPLGVYMLLMSLTRRIGLTMLLCLPLMFYGAFQLVLLYLYGSHIIAIDMLLNVATTNVGEASELLGSLTPAICLVLILYLPPIIYAIVSLCRRRLAPQQSVATARRAGVVVTAIGVAAFGAAWATSPGRLPQRQIFPVNVACNTIEAFRREAQSQNYAKTSASFCYHAHSTRLSQAPEVYVMVIGETSRADHWQLLGYHRPTTPRLARHSDIVAFHHAMSESNTTHKCVPMLMSHLQARQYGDSIAYTKSIISAFNEAGYETAFLSTQHPNHSYIDYFGNEAQTVDFVVEEDSCHYDGELLPRLRAVLAHAHAPKVMIVLHTYGSHFNYRDRYPREFRVFDNDEFVSASPSAREQLVNAYDNTICYTDYVLDSVISQLDSLSCPAALIYSSDHGEDLYDDDRERFLHASPTPTHYQLHVPMMIWMSDEYRAAHPDSWRCANDHRYTEAASTQAMFHTLLDLAGIDTPYFNCEQSLINPAYHAAAHYYVNDYNEAVPLPKRYRPI